jgi:hypothetical protein
MADPYGMSDYLQGRRNLLLDQWQATAPTLGAEAQPNLLLPHINMRDIDRRV